MPPRPKTVTVTVRLPEGLVKQIDDAAGKIRLSRLQGLIPEDYYRGGRSAIIRLLLTIGIRAFKKSASTTPRKRA